MTDKDDATQSSLNAKLHDELMKQIDFSIRDAAGGGGGGGGAGRPLKPSVRKYLEKWLLQRATCRLHPAWTDLGPLFWPRWVRRGSCGDDDGLGGGGSSCSWPPGMRCVPEVSRTVRLLHWHCGATSRRRRPSDQQATAGGECYVSVLMVSFSDFCCRYGLIFSARCNMYISRLCYDVTVRLSVCGAL